MGELPATIRDAIGIACVLGIPYLWIDALCIVQDDERDWEAQSPKIGDYYSNAVLTIAATSSTRADSGLLNERIADFTPLTLPCLFGGQELFQPTPDISRNLHDAPIFTRAWTTQELYLSRRILHFTDAFLAWECRCLHSAEHYPNGFPSRSDPDVVALGVFPDYSAKEFFRSTTMPRKLAHEAWKDVIRGYSSKRMTKEQDILVAIAGLAGAMQRATGNEYLAGLWRETLEHDLLWQSDESRQRPDVYRAPTWSWASTKSYSDGEASGSSHISLEFLEVDRMASYLAMIDSCSVSYRDQTHGSRVLAGRLGITGKLAEMEFFHEGVWASSPGSEVYARVPTFNAIGDVIFDTRDMVEAEMPYLYRTRTTETQLYCLAITKLDEESSYEDRPWMGPGLDDELRDQERSAERFDRLSWFHLVSKKKSLPAFTRITRFSIDDATNPDIDIYNTSPVELHGWDWVEWKPGDSTAIEPEEDVRVPLEQQSGLDVFGDSVLTPAPKHFPQVDAEEVISSHLELDGSIRVKNE